MHEIKEIKKKELSKADSFKLLNDNLEYVLKKISNNISYASIAKEFNINVANLCFFLNQDEIREKKEVALKIASYVLLEDAVNELHKIEDEAHNATVRRQCELYNHKIYIAKIKNRKELDLNYREEKQETNNNIVVIPATQALELLNNNKNKQESNQE